MSDTYKDKNMIKYKKAWEVWLINKGPIPSTKDFNLRWDKRGYTKRPSWWHNLTFYRLSRRKCKLQLIKNPLDYISWDVSRKPMVYWD